MEGIKGRYWKQYGLLDYPEYDNTPSRAELEYDALVDSWHDQAQPASNFRFGIEGILNDGQERLDTTVCISVEDDDGLSFTVWHGDVEDIDYERSFDLDYTPREYNCSSRKTSTGPEDKTEQSKLTKTEKYVQFLKEFDKALDVLDGISGDDHYESYEGPDFSEETYRQEGEFYGRKIWEVVEKLFEKYGLAQAKPEDLYIQDEAFFEATKHLRENKS